jgi:preprotein translocase subunit SecF
MNVIKLRWLFLGFSIALLVASAYGIAVFGLQKGIDFTGGTLWNIDFAASQTSTSTAATTFTRADLATFVQETLGEKDAVVTEQEGTRSFLIKTKEMSEPVHQEYRVKIAEKFGSFKELSFESIGAVIGAELARKAFWAFGINLLAISLYVAYAFRKVSEPVSSWKYAVITMLTLFHDAVIPVGLFAFLGRFGGIEVDTNFIVAILVVIGFSVHDTIVVFDRIRENLRTAKATEEFGALVNRSINETFARSLNTSLTLIIVLVILFLLGATTLKYFVLAMLVGTVAGTYSSIFVAAPLLVVWQRLSTRSAR